MKKYFIFLSVIIFLLGGCSVQEKMSPQIFFERLSKKTDFFDLKNKECFFENSDYISFVKDKYSTEYVFDISVTENGDINKIGFSCDKTEKAEDFICCVREIISVYSPDENHNEIIGSLTENGKPKTGLNYYDTQWYSWCSYADKNGLFFSVTNKKLTSQSTVEFSLKPNDKSGF